MVTYVNRLSALINSKISVNILKFYFALHKVQDGFLNWWSSSPLLKW